MNSTTVEQIANAVLYEGYLLYPYRASAVKNQRRFNWGVLVPPSYSEAQRGTEAASLTAECLVIGHARTQFEVKARFLQLRTRQVLALSEPVASWNRAALQEARPTPSLTIGAQTYQSCDEAVEREVYVDCSIDQLLGKQRRQEFSFFASAEDERLLDGKGGIAGVLARSQSGIEGTIELTAGELSPSLAKSDGRLFKVTIQVLNRTAMDDAAQKSRDEVLHQSFLSTHAILRVKDGEFVSLLEPGSEFSEAVASCQNTGVWPVLAGEIGERTTMLASPIILYDYPELAAESPGELFDGTEIDEILTLRIMTLTDQEKEEMRQGDERARRILERTESMVPEEFMKLHGVLRRPRAFGDEPQ